MFYLYPDFFLKITVDFLKITVLCFCLSFHFRFDGRVVAKLPFTPLSYIQGLSHRNLLGDDTTDCSFIFLYILCTMSIRQVSIHALLLCPVLLPVVAHTSHASNAGNVYFLRALSVAPLNSSIIHSCIKCLQIQMTDIRDGGSRKTKHGSHTLLEPQFLLHCICLSTVSLVIPISFLSHVLVPFVSSGVFTTLEVVGPGRMEPKHEVDACNSQFSSEHQTQSIYIHRFKKNHMSKG